MSLEEPMQVGKTEVLVVYATTCDTERFLEVHHATVEPDIADWHIRHENGFPEIVLDPHTSGNARLTVTYKWGDASRDLSTDIVVVGTTEE